MSLGTGCAAPGPGRHHKQTAADELAHSKRLRRMPSWHDCCKCLITSSLLLHVSAPTHLLPVGQAHDDVAQHRQAAVDSGRLLQPLPPLAFCRSLPAAATGMD